MSTNASLINPDPLSCPACKQALGGTWDTVADLASCPSCEKKLSVRVYPASRRSLAGAQSGHRTVFNDESSCFFHVAKRAETVCDQCGRYLCPLCETNMESQTLCVECLEAAHAEGTLNTLVDRRIRHDSIALMLALFPILAWPLTTITAPTAVIYALLKWNAPPSLVSSSKIRLVAAILLGLLQIAGWTALILFMLR